MAFIAVGIGIAGIGLGIGKSILEGDAKKAAIRNQRDALMSLESLDLDELKTLAADTDLERYRKQFEAQREVDPVFAALRDQGGRSLLSGIMQDRSGTTLADTALKQLEAENKSAEGDQTGTLINDLIDRARQDLEAGATLPPEFQAELVKAGLENAGGTGLSIEGRGATGTNIRRLVGAEGLALKQAREQGAVAKLTAAQQARANRISILSNLMAASNNLSNAKTARAGGAIQVGSGAVPSIGLSGQDAVKISAANTDFENKRLTALGDLKAQRSLADGAMWGGVLGSIGSGVSSIAGGITGGGGAGSWISGLFGGGSNKPATSNYNPNAGYVVPTPWDY